MTELDESVWFAGPVRDAITLVSQKNCTLLVYIHDDSEKTTTFNSVLNQDNVINAIKENTVALAMKKDSENAGFFGQYYPIQAVPILYFIKQGTIRDFAIESATSQEVVDKINAVDQLPTAVASTQTTENQSVSTAIPSTQTAENESVSTTIPPTQTIDNESVSTVITPTQTTDNQNISTATDDVKAAKKAELQKQLEKVRKERAEREQKESKEKEIKRRQDAKVMQEAKQYQENKENKVYFDKIKKERKEDEEHRKRVREQIARDRAEKIAQRNAEKQQRQASVVVEKTNKSTDYQLCNLNIRQLDGSNVRHQFDSTATLSMVRDWIQQNRTDESRAPYKLSSQFPTRLFTDADNSTTLKDLNLCPSATIIMKPMKSQPKSNGGGGVVTLVFTFIYGLIVGIFNMFRNFLTSRGAVLPDPQQGGMFKSNSGQRLGGEGASSSSSTSNTSNVQRRNPYATRISTIHDDDDDLDNDKKRPTYNGNSVNHE